MRTLLTALEELTLLLLPHGGQRTARRNARRASADLYVGNRQASDLPPRTGRIPAQSAQRIVVGG
jgi:hypothetical protein